MREYTKKHRVPVALGNEIYAKLKVRVTNSDCNSIVVCLKGTNTGDSTEIIVIDSPVENEWYEVSGLLKTPNDFTGNYEIRIYHFYDDADKANGKIMEIYGSDDSEVLLLDFTLLYNLNVPELFYLDTYNLLANSDFSSGTTTWRSSHASNFVANSVLTNTLDGSENYGYVYQSTSKAVIANEEIYTNLKVRVTSPDCLKIRVYVGDTSNDIRMQLIEIPDPVENQWYSVSGLFTTPSNFTGNYQYYIYQYYESETIANGKVMEIDGTDGNEPILIDFTQVCNYIDYYPGTDNVISNEDFANGTTNWQGAYSSNSVSAGILTNTLNGSESYGRVYQETLTPVSVGSKIYCSISARVTNSSCHCLSVEIDGTDGGTSKEICIIENPEEGQWYNISGILQIPDDFLGNYLVKIYHYYDDEATASGKVMQIDGGSKVTVANFASLDNLEGQDYSNDDDEIDIVGNNIIFNPNFANGTTAWYGNYCNIAVSDNIMSSTLGDSNNYGYICQISSLPIKIDDEIYAKLKVRVTNSDCERICVRLDSTEGSERIKICEIENPTQNEWYDLSGIVMTPDTFSGEYKIYIYHEYADSSTANGKVLEIDGSGENSITVVDFTKLQNSAYNAKDYNILVNEDFSEGTSDWNSSYSANTVSNNILTNTTDGTTSYSYVKQETITPIIIGNKVFVKAKVRVTNSDCYRIHIRLEGSYGGTRTEIARIDEPNQNQWYDIYGSFEIPSDFVGAYTLYIYQSYNNASSGRAMEIDCSDNDIALIDLSKLFEEEPNGDEFNSSYISADSYNEIELSSLGLSEGIHTLYFRAKDSSDNVGGYNVCQFFLDSLAPVVTLSEPINNSAI